MPDLENIIFENDPTIPDIVELRNIKQTYDGSHYIIDNCHLLVEKKNEKGNFISIIGESGCGKSTLLRFMCNLQKPTSGSILINGKPNINHQIGMVFQQYSSIPWLTVLDNVAIGLEIKGVNKKEREEKAKAMLEVVGLTDHMYKYARYPILSGGQLQRVAIARSLIVNSDILLMDEPFGALDTNTRIKMQELLLDIWKTYGLTIIFVTHDISEAVYLSQEIFIMKANPGRIVKRIIPNLPIDKTHEIKRDFGFIRMVNDIEDYIKLISTMQ
jgi:NitT/TauT family transport system ATP-binding protein